MMKTLNKFYSRWYRTIGGITIAAGLILCVWLGGRLTRETSIQEGIAQQIIRFHVIANSDSEKDQELKMQIKEGVVSYMETLLKDARSIEDTRNSILSNLGKIKEKAAEIMTQKGYAYTITAALENCYFPMKSYGDMTFPAGEYEALRIRIGAAEGKNWWCVLYPNLCFIDSIHAVVPEDEKDELKNVLTEEEYDSLLGDKKPEFRISFKYLPFGK